ncbi:bifunctional folylpolyglutamate synthase/dihydrofolate synthase [Pontibacillus yanchengensis]|uniref:Dihydrofolate synthase/folylpolyglutamate synthase n=1 Tax=Pontibacillus yanchengensis TaxID=462910 RepID=A0A6I4ZVL6_9BACI|nr:folylpolyglutamate synthase/dihydrofolate synthase family protein [Pontibacillus yanchengensis]MYL34225.1 bifunctional folylpolyglutamate synthase/dihydrofolate synthase [Pontibacillus yanchengensis]
MDYQEAIEWIHNRHKFGIKTGLQRMEWLMDHLGNPEQRLHAIHVAGTNGKGSTISFIRNILQAHGYQVGTFTSPYVVTFNERISINGEPLADEEWSKLVEKIKPLAEELENSPLGGPTEFEIITALAILYFAEHPMDFVLMETGLGGRLDSTNVISPILSIITSIGKDHTALLGDTFEEIASEKAGIIKPSVPAITGVEKIDALEVIKKKAISQDAPLDSLGEQFQIIAENTTQNGELFTFKNQFVQWDKLLIHMKGRHQMKNAALAIQAVTRCLDYVREEKVREGIITTSWVGRFEQVFDQPTIILDGAHNEEGIQAMTQTVRDHYQDREKHLLFAALHDKPLDKMIPLFTGTFDTVTFTTFEFPRASDAEELYNLSHHHNKSKTDDWKIFIENRMKTLSNEDVLVISGSLYFISEVRKFFENIG